MMNILAKILSHGFAVAVVVLLAVGFIYRGELFPELQLPDFLSPDSETVAETGNEGEASAVVPATAESPALARQGAATTAADDTGTATRADFKGAEQAADVLTGVAQVEGAATGEIAPTAPVERGAADAMDEPVTFTAEEPAPADMADAATAQAPDTAPVEEPAAGAETAAPAAADTVDATAAQAPDTAPVEEPAAGAETAAPAAADTVDATAAQAPDTAPVEEPAAGAETVAPAAADTGDAAAARAPDTATAGEPAAGVETAALAAADTGDAAAAQAPDTAMAGEPAAGVEDSVEAATELTGEIIRPLATTKVAPAPAAPTEAVPESQLAGTAATESAAGEGAVEAVAEAVDLPRAVTPDAGTDETLDIPVAESAQEPPPGRVQQPTEAPAVSDTRIAAAIPALEAPIEDTTAAADAAATGGSAVAEANPYQLLASAREAYWLHDYEQAETIYRELTVLEPDNPDWFGELGNMYFSQGKWDDSASAYYEAGTRLVKAGRLDRARELVNVIRGLNGSRAQELEKMIQEAAASANQ